MNYFRCEFSSKTLEMCTPFIVLLPEEVPAAQTPVIYLLHGLSDNCTGWTRFTSVERYAREHVCAVVMPEVQRSFYADMALGLRYFEYISQELPGFCRRTFGLPAEREKNFVMGLSMGGYGALKCALTFPERYAGCGAFSSVTDLAARRARATVSEQREFDALYGPGREVPPESDLYALLEKADATALPRFFLTCGDADALLPDNVRMAEALQERDCTVRFETRPGGHEWRLWDWSVAAAMDELLPAKDV